MDLEDVKLSRRNFLKLAGIAAAGAAVPGLYLSVEAPRQYNDLAGLTGGTAPRTLFMQPYMPTMGGDVVTATIVVDHSAQGDGDLNLIWSGLAEAEFGWWADYWEIQEKCLLAPVAPVVAIPETVARFPSAGLDRVTRSELGQLEMMPGRLLNISLCMPDSAAPWKVEPGGVMIHGLDLAYDA